MKKYLLILTLLLLPATIYAYDAEINGIYYNLNSSTKTATVTYRTTSYNSYSGVITIPESVNYNGKPYSVTSIGNSAFYKCSGLTSVTIPNSVTSIGAEAFDGCSNLTSVHISDLEAWCKCRFYTFDGGACGNPLINAHHLYLNGKEITNLTIPNSITSVSDYAFRGCSGLTSVAIPNSVTKIGDGAFNGCI